MDYDKGLRTLINFLARVQSDHLHAPFNLVSIANTGKDKDKYLIKCSGCFYGTQQLWDIVIFDTTIQFYDIDGNQTGPCIDSVDIVDFCDDNLIYDYV